MNITILEEKLLSDNWYILKKFTYQYQTRLGETRTTSREAYDRGNGATVLLYNKDKDTVILTRQFRLPTFINGNRSGMLIETCAGLLDNDEPEEAIRRETEEETGYRIERVDKVFEAYMSPGSVTEKLYFFLAYYTDQQKVFEGGGVDDEDIEVIEIPFTQAMKMVRAGEIQDGKTIMLLQHLLISGAPLHRD
jgi:nudix-type nucleoside diphosphatase (YffH/AdpP family)